MPFFHKPSRYLCAAILLVGSLLPAISGCRMQTWPSTRDISAAGTVVTTVLGTPAATAALSAVTLEPELSAWRAAGIEPFCLILGDTDGDGEKEWVGLHQERAGDWAGVQGFVLDGDQFYPLGGLESAEPSSMVGCVLGDDALPALAIRDVNADGKTEIIAGGQNRDGQSQMSIFLWDPQGEYRLLAYFSGSESIAARDKDGDGALEIIVVNRVGPGVLFEEISVWDGTRYVLSRGRYLRSSSYAGALSVSTPEQALMAFYLSLEARDVATAYGLLAPAMQERQKYDAFLLSQAAVDSFELGELRRIREGGEIVVLSGRLWLTKTSANRASRESYQGEWRLASTGSGWQIEAISLIPEKG